MEKYVQQHIKMLKKKPLHKDIILVCSFPPRLYFVLGS